MRHRGLHLVLLALLGAPALAAHAGDDLAAWQARQQAAARADAAQQALSERYTAIWTTLDAGQKRDFGRRERAWLNAGRLDEQQACVNRAGGAGELQAMTCEAAVIERHLDALPAPQRLAASR